MPGKGSPKKVGPLKKVRPFATRQRRKPGHTQLTQDTIKLVAQAIRGQLVFDGPRGTRRERIVIKIPHRLMRYARSKDSHTVLTYLNAWLTEAVLLGQKYKAGHITRDVFLLEAGRKLQTIEHDIRDL